MTWICPDCGKRFRNRNQEHSCAVTDIETHLRNKSQKVRTIYDRLMAAVVQFGDININPVKTSIQVKAGATFLSIKPMKSKIEIQFQLGREVLFPPIYKNFRISRHRVLHFAVLESEHDVDGRLLEFLRESYLLIRGD